MFRAPQTPRLFSRAVDPPISPLSQRQFSVISVHSTSPATLYRFQPQRSSSPSKQKTNNEGSVAKNGLVYPRISESIPYSNGPVFRPNTVSMQELLRNNYDVYCKNLEGGAPTADPHVICIPKGTVVPSNMILFREQGTRFSLQPLHPVSLHRFNKILDKFYTSSATFDGAVEWMEANELHEAFADGDSEAWMRE